MKNEIILKGVFDRRLKLPRSIFSDSISSDVEPIICANPLNRIESRENLTQEDVANLIGGHILNYNQSENESYRF